MYEAWFDELNLIQITYVVSSTVRDRSVTVLAGNEITRRSGLTRPPIILYPPKAQSPPSNVAVRTLEELADPR